MVKKRVMMSMLAGGNRPAQAGTPRGKATSLLDGGNNANPRQLSKKWYEGVRSKTPEELMGEYTTLKAEVDTGRFDAFEKMAGAKMRHKAVVLFDDTRVVLKSRDSDFIHASYVDGWGDGRKRAWIIAMAPITDTLPDFWHMVWQEKVPVIVMLCQVKEPGEGGKMIEKCAQYWPTQRGEKVGPLGPYTVECENTYLDAPICEGQKIQVSALWIWCHGSRRRLYHYQYLSWGDHDVPSSQNGMVHFTRLVETQWKDMAKQPHYSPSSPILVHCSAGLGRSGTFVAVCNSMKGAMSSTLFSVADVVRKIRAQRFQAVQNERQYLYIYQCVYAFLKKISHLPASVRIPHDPKDPKEPPGPGGPVQRTCSLDASPLAPITGSPAHIPASPASIPTASPAATPTTSPAVSQTH